MKNGEPTVSWPTDQSSFYIHVMFHEFFYGPYPTLSELLAARKRLDAKDEYWNYDCDAAVKGDTTPEGQRRIEKLTYINRDTGEIVT